MSEIIGFLFGYGIPIAVALVAVVAVLLAMGTAMAGPKYIVLGYLVILMVFPMSSSYGLLDAADATIVYVKGTKTFFFSFLDMAIFGTWLLTVVYCRRLYGMTEPLGPMMKFYLGFAGVFFSHVLFGLFDPATNSLLDFYGRGVINVLWQGMLIALLLTVTRTEKELKFIIFLMIFCTAGREVFGMVRYLFLGGDPQNAYATLQNLNVKITFWDINDSVLAAFVLGFSVWKLLVEQVKGLWTRFGYLSLTLMSALTVVLSARRTAQGGLLLAMLVLVWLLPRGRRGAVILALALLAPLAIVVTAARTEGPATMLQKVLIDVKTDANADPRKSRFYEFQSAWPSIQENLLFGVGPSGSFSVRSHYGLEYHKGNYDFIHSGFGHVLLKTGLVGLFLFLAIFYVYLKFIASHWRSQSIQNQAFFAASLTAFAAQMPNMIFGTPIGEIRTMMVLAVIFAIPFMTVYVARRPTAPAKNVVGPSLSSRQSFGGYMGGVR